MERTMNRPTGLVEQRRVASFLRRAARLGCAALLGFALIGTVQAAIPTSERAVLLNLYDSSNGANWTNKTGWNGAAGTECSWFGVTCNGAQSNVNSVNLRQNNLKGSLPSISGLTSLVSFDVAHNQLTGAIPSPSGLSSLQVFYVQGNQLTGAIPSLSGLTALLIIDVQGNQLTGTIPSLNGLTALLYFSVHHNQLTGTIPSISDLSSLESFWVHNNQLTGAIPSLSGRSSLRNFWVNNNQLTGVIPSLTGLVSLQNFVVSDNQLTGAIPAAPSALVAGNSNLCNNQLQTSGNAAIDAAWTTAAGNWLACQTVTNTVPTANPVTISGTAQVGQVLSGRYTYADANSDPENTSASGTTYRFMRRGASINCVTAPCGGTITSGATNGSTKTYTLQAADVGSYLAYCVTPVASSGATPGSETCSAETALVTTAPVSIPVCQLTASPSTIASGSSATLQASCSPAATSYRWSGACASVTGATCTVAPTATTTYNVTGSNASGSSNPASATVTVTDPSPTLSLPLCTLSANPSTVLPGGTSTLTASCSPTATTYTWSGGTCAGQTGPTCIDRPTATTNYRVIGSNSAGSSYPASATVTPFSVQAIVINQVTSAVVTYNPADLGKTGSIYIFAYLDSHSPLLANSAVELSHIRSGEIATAPRASNGQVLAYKTRTGWKQAASNGVLEPAYSGTLSDSLNTFALYDKGLFIPGQDAGIICLAITTATGTSAKGQGLPVVIGKDASATCPDVTLTAPSYQGLWWNPNEPGWGMSITQHGSIAFNALYTYDALGQPVWYVMSSCPISANGCSGDLYQVSGGSSPTLPWAGTVKVDKAGFGSLSFTDADSGTLAFILNGMSGSKTISRNTFASGSDLPTVDYTDLWWNPAESGWGLSLTQQYGVIFATWYSYDASGQAVWYVLSDCPVSGNGCTGDLYRVSGGTPLNSPWNTPNKQVTKVGAGTLSFTDKNNGIVSYTINGAAGQRTIVRQAF